MYIKWLDYFDFNRNHMDHLDYNPSDELTTQEKAIIFKSIQQFQKGENSEGKNLIKFSKELHDPIYEKTIKVFIKEEQNHAKVLSRFMQIHDIPKIKDHWADNVFRYLRKLSDLENSIMVLISAEIVAAVYYRALRDATNSKLLIDICKQILIDEDQHLNFQCQTLNLYYRNHSDIKKKITRATHLFIIK